MLRRSRQSLLACFAIVVLAATWSSAARAHVFYSKKAALKLAFPRADAVETRHLFLSHAQATQLAKLSGQPVSSRLAWVYVGKRAGRALGYALISTRTVRTRPATFMIVLGRAGRVRAVHVLAFYEPREYMPTKEWLQQFKSSKLRSSRGVAAVAGSTLSARAANAAVRWALAVYQVTLRAKASSSAGR